MKNKNSNLHQAKKAKNDEFYTKYNDIAEELRHYTKHFEGKIVFCNCDDPEYSKFWQYFETKFDDLKLKKLIATHYTEEDSNVPSYKLEYDGVNTIKTPLLGNGDFRSNECIEILKECDICVTNPPFSLFRSFISLLMEYDKKFLIIGNKNAITYKEFFPLLKDNKVWIGYNSVKEFLKPDGSTQKFGNIGWFTNLDIDKRHDKLTLLMDYDINDYQRYDNYNAINVDKIKDIPYGYDGYIGVPITFLDKYCPEQFEILGNSAEFALPLTINGKLKNKPQRFYIDGKRLYDRILIKAK